MKIRLGYDYLDLSPGTSISMEEHSPIFAEEITKGSFSYSFSVPATDSNCRIFGYPVNIDNTASLQRTFENCEIEADGELMSGVLKLRKINKSTFQFNFITGSITIAQLLKTRSLRSFAYGGKVEIPQIYTQNGLIGRPARMKNILYFATQTITAPFGTYPFVFAPVHNQDFYESDSNTIVNPYQVWLPEAQYSGVSILDANGSSQSFGYIEYRSYQYYSVNGDWVHSYPQTLPPLCPFPYLKFVLEKIFEELEIGYSSAFFDAELSRLVMLLNASLSRKFGLPSAPVHESAFWDITDAPTGFWLNRLMPEMSVLDLLNKLRVSFGLAVNITVDGNVEIIKLSDILAATDYADLTNYVVPTHELEVNDPIGMTFTYSLTDSISEKKGAIPDPEFVNDPVQTHADLPDYWLEVNEPDEIRLVLDEGKYYQYKEEMINDVFVQHWVYYSDLLPLPVIGDGANTKEQGISLTFETVCTQPPFMGPYSDHPHTNAQYDWRIPSIGTEAYAPTFGNFNKESTLRLAFYRGMQPFTNIYPNYPMLGVTEFNALNQVVGNYSLRLDGERGIYVKFLKPWFEWYATAKPVTVQLNLSFAQVKNLNLKKKVRIAGNNYLVKKLKYVLPLTKPVIAELMHCK